MNRDTEQQVHCLSGQPDNTVRPTEKDSSDHLKNARYQIWIQLLMMCGFLGDKYALEALKSEIEITLSNKLGKHHENNIFDETRDLLRRIENGQWLFYNFDNAVMQLKKQAAGESYVGTIDENLSSDTDRLSNRVGNNGLLPATRMNIGLTIVVSPLWPILLLVPRYFGKTVSDRLLSFSQAVETTCKDREELPPMNNRAACYSRNLKRFKEWGEILTNAFSISEAVERRLSNESLATKEAVQHSIDFHRPAPNEDHMDVMGTAFNIWRQNDNPFTNTICKELQVYYKHIDGAHPTCKAYDQPHKLGTAEETQAWVKAACNFVSNPSTDISEAEDPLIPESFRGAPKRLLSSTAKESVTQIITSVENNDIREYLQDIFVIMINPSPEPGTGILPRTHKIAEEFAERNCPDDLKSALKKLHNLEGQSLRLLHFDNADTSDVDHWQKKPEPFYFIKGCFSDRIVTHPDNSEYAVQAVCLIREWILALKKFSKSEPIVSEVKRRMDDIRMVKDCDTVKSGLKAYALDWWVRGMPNPPESVIKRDMRVAEWLSGFDPNAERLAVSHGGIVEKMFEPAFKAWSALANFPERSR
jgi:hypothetical protein